MLSGVTRLNNYKTRFLSILFLWLIIGSSHAQEIRINCKNEPLNLVLRELKNQYSLQLSYDEKLLSGYNITAERAFESPESAIKFFITGLPLAYEVRNNIFIIYSLKPRKSQVNFILSGKISDRVNKESLPFAGILVNNFQTGSDANGSFSVLSATDSVFHLKISYIGYYILDTLIKAGSGINIMMTPSVTSIREIKISGTPVARTIQTGILPGSISINHKVARYLPGNSDNSVFNLLRLQPGILASGEQSADLIIWGGYEGQSSYIFDGFTIYGMKNFNDNISAVNPLMVKDIKVMKGGFGAEYGERVAGIIDITGLTGDKSKPSFQGSVNNMTVNGTASVPLSDRSALLLAYRQTYYDLYNPVEFSSTTGYGRGRQSGSQADYYLIPDYRFRDMNLKFSGSGNKSDYYLSLYTGKDNFSYNFDQSSTQKSISLNHNEENFQAGGTFSYGLKWKDRFASYLIISYSHLNSLLTHNETITKTSGPSVNSEIYDNTTTGLQEINIRNLNNFNISTQHRIEAGLGTLFYNTRKETVYEADSSSLIKIGSKVPYFYFQDIFSPGKKLSFKTGLRADLNSISGKIYLQPRISFNYRINNYLKLTAAAGLYNQFVAKNMIIETSGNYRLDWAVCDGKEIAVLHSAVVSSGLMFDRNGFLVSADGYIKRTGGIMRFLENTSGIPGSYEGNGKTEGVDIYIKKEVRDQIFWLSYTLSRSTELFQYFPSDNFIPAMQDQRHELKLAALTRYRSFHLSVNYVFGSGFPDPDLLPDQVVYLQPYSRLDAAFTYSHSGKMMHLDAGISVLNVLNTENIRYSNYTRIPTDETTTIKLYAEAVPITPTLFLNISF